MREPRGRLQPQAAEIVIELWLDHPEVAEALALTRWFGDGINNRDLENLDSLLSLVAKDPSVALEVAASSWFSDSLNEEERALLGWLGRRAESPSFTNEHPEHGGSLSRDLVRYFLYTRFWEPDHVDAFAEEPWFKDGLNPIEMAFIVASSSTAREHPALHTALLEARFAATRSISLPLRGNVTIWVFQNTRFAEGDGVLDVIEKTARELERFFEDPFPTTDIIVVLGDSATVGVVPGQLGSFYKTHLWMTRIGEDVPELPHEVAHYYFTGGPIWLIEGGNEFFVTYSGLRRPETTVADHRTWLEAFAEGCFSREGVLNIRHYNLKFREEERRGYDICPYVFGERLLWRAVDAVGEDDLVSALRAWNRTADIFRSDLGKPRLVDYPYRPEEHVHLEFTGAISPVNRAAFEAVYRELHGGRYEDAGYTVQDDYGDTMRLSSEFTLGAGVSGVIDGAFDFDYFRFAAEEGQRYRIRYEHDVPTTTLAIYHRVNNNSYTRSFYGQYEYYGKALARINPSVASRLPQVWTAPETKTYYVAIQNFGGSPGPYTFSLEPLAEEQEAASRPDRTGGESLREVGVLGRFEGTLSGPGDSHLWRFDATPERSYRFDIEHHDRQVFRVQLLDGAGEPMELWVAGEFELLESTSISVEWTAMGPSEHYVLVDGAEEDNVSYTLTITEVESGPQ